MISHDSCYLYILSFLLISLIFEISKTLLTTWRQRTRQELYLLDYINWISHIFKTGSLKHVYVHFSVCLYMYICVCTYINIFIYICVSLHVHSIASGYVAWCCQLQHVTLDQVYPKLPPPLQKNNQFYAWSAQGSGSLRSTDGNKYSCWVVSASALGCIKPNYKGKWGWDNYLYVVFPPKQSNTQASWNRKQAFGHPWKVSDH